MNLSTFQGVFTQLNAIEPTLFPWFDLQRLHGSKLHTAVFVALNRQFFQHFFLRFPHDTPSYCLQLSLSDDWQCHWSLIEFHPVLFYSLEHFISQPIFLGLKLLVQRLALHGLFQARH